MVLFGLDVIDPSSFASGKVRGCIAERRGQATPPAGRTVETGLMLVLRVIISE